MKISLAGLTERGGLPEEVLLGFKHGVMQYVPAPDFLSATGAIPMGEIHGTRAELSAYVGERDSSKGPERRLLASAEARMHIDEPFFVKETGRKVALKRLLEKIKAPREVRRRIWASYHSRKGPSSGEKPKLSGGPLPALSEVK